MSRGPLTRLVVAIAAIAVGACSGPALAPSGDALAPPDPPAPPSAPDTAVALRDGAVVELDVGSGEVVDRVPVEGLRADGGLAVAGSRHTAVVTRAGSDGRVEIVEVDLGDGSTRVLGDGRRPAVSDDGRHLAWVREVPDTARRELVAATSSGSEEAAWTIEESATEDVEVLGLSWSPTADELVVTVRSATGTEVRVLPVDRSGSLRGASEVVPPTSHGAELVAATFRGPHHLTVAEGCCTPGAHDRWRVLDVTLGTFDVAELVPDLADAVTHLDWDAGLAHLLLTVRGTPAVRRWSAEGVEGVEDVADDGAAAAWS